MFLFSGVLAPLLQPRYSPGSGEASDAERPAVPPTVQAILETTSGAAAERAIADDPAFLLDREERGFMTLHTHLGCLVSTGGPLGSEPGRGDLVADFVGLARAGGRIPVVRHARAENLALYQAHGMICRRTGEEAFVELNRIAPDSLTRSGLALRIEDAERRDTTVDIVPTAWIGPMLLELRAIAPDIDADRLRSAPLAVVRLEGRVVAFATLWSNHAGSELALDTVYVDANATLEVYPFLVAKLAAWGRARGFERLSLGTRRAWSGWEPSAELFSSLPIRIEARYTARPGGIRGGWASLTLNAFTEERGQLA
jgi:lysylphosphatidylglycerol synthetase-like protein (DUF2156 family)